jgi:outer membrane protein assembly factor BamD (BamD/ComL family)
MTDKDPLKDNVLLAQTMLIADEQLRAEKLAQFNTKYLNTDGGMEALYRLALLQRKFWSQLQSNSEQKKKLLADTRQTMTSFLGIYPDSIYAEQIKKVLSDLPNVD